MKKLSDITGLEKIQNSVLQMRQWLSKNGLEMESLGKSGKRVKDCIKGSLQTSLLLRQQLSKSSD